MTNSNNSQANSNDQFNIVFNAFFESPKTMQEVSKETGVMRSNICWYVRDFRNQRIIAMVGYRKCNVTKYGKVGIYTTNPDLFPESNQLKLF
jgi:hypothetical protein